MSGDGAALPERQNKRDNIGNGPGSERLFSAALYDREKPEGRGEFPDSLELWQDAGAYPCSGKILLQVWDV